MLKEFKRLTCKLGKEVLVDVIVQLLRGWVDLTSGPMVMVIWYFSYHNASSDGVGICETESINTP